MFWLLIGGLVIVGFVGAGIIMERSGDYDFVTPFIGLGWLLAFIVLAVGLVIGKLAF